MTKRNERVPETEKTEKPAEKPVMLLSPEKVSIILQFMSGAPMPHITGDKAAVVALVMQELRQFLATVPAPEPEKQPEPAEQADPN